MLKNNTENCIDDPILEVIPPSVFKALKGSQILTEDMTFVDAEHAIRAIYTREQWFRSLGMKPHIKNPIPWRN